MTPNTLNTHYIIINLFSASDMLSSRFRSKGMGARNMKSMRSPSVTIFMTNFYRAGVEEGGGGGVLTSEYSSKTKQSFNLIQPKGTEERYTIHHEAYFLF